MSYHSQIAVMTHIKSCNPSPMVWLGRYYHETCKCDEPLPSELSCSAPHALGPRECRERPGVQIHALATLPPFPHIDV